MLGETGTGKGLAANAVHMMSQRCAGPLIQVNCGAIPEGLVESELFGHERGAFTGANSRKLGKVELAEGGTLFLDEIGDLALEAQVKILRLLEERVFERVGGTETLAMDVRIIAATNRNLEHARISSSACTPFRSNCPLCASGGKISPCWRPISWTAWPSICKSRSCRSSRMPLGRYMNTTGRAMCGSWKMC